MKQKLLNSIRLRAMMLVAVMCAAFAGQAWADTAGYTPSAALSSTTGSVTGTAGESWSYSITFDNAGYYGYVASYGWQLGAGPKSGKDRGCRAFSISTSDITGVITKIEVEAGSYNGNSKINVTVGGADFGTQNQSTYSGQGASKSTFTGSASGEIIISATDAVRAFYLKSITVTYTPGGGGGSDPSISLGTTSINVTKDEVDDGSISVTYNNLTDYEADVIFYEADGETQTDYDWITASINGEFNVEYLIDANTGSARTAYMKVYAVDDEGEAFSDLITFTQASGIDAPSFSPAAGKVDAGTTITLTQAAADEIRYTTDGTDPTKTTGTVYSGPIEITTTTTIKAIAVKGDGVSAVASAAYTINVAAPEYNLASSGNYLAGTDLILTSDGNTIYYNMTINSDAPGNPTSSSMEYNGPISLSSGTVKVKAIAYDTYGNASTVTSRTINGIAPATLPFNWAGGSKTDLIALTGVVGGGLGSDYDSGSHSPYLVKFDTDGDYIEIFTNAQPLKVSVGVKMIGGKTTSKIKVQESTNGAEFSDVQELTISGAQNDIVNLATTEAFASTTRVIKLLFVKGANVGVGPISILGGTLSATLNTSGYATFASTYALDFSDDSEYSAWQVTAANSGTGVLTFSQITGTVAAGTGVLLKGSASASINIPVAASGSDISATNKLTGITTATDVTAGQYYGLKANAFVPVNAGTVPAGKALLPTSVAAGVKAFTFVFDDVETGIQVVDNVQGTMDNAEIYNLAGQRMSKMQRGVNIVNGKKVLVK